MATESASLNYNDCRNCKYIKQIYIREERLLLNFPFYLLELPEAPPLYFQHKPELSKVLSEAERDYYYKNHGNLNGFKIVKIGSPAEYYEYWINKHKKIGIFNSGKKR